MSPRRMSRPELGRLRARFILVGLATALALVGGARASAVRAPAWLTYHHGAARTGFDPDSSAHPVTPKAVWQSPRLDGQLYAQPLVLGSRVFAATENNTVYALNAATGKILWHRNAGKPVPASALPCGDITPVVGITGTPVIDGTTKAIYAVADVFAGGHARHMLVGYRLTDGHQVITPRVLDVGGGTNPDFVPVNQLQRAALALDGREIVIPFGGNWGDCGRYHGWVVASREDGTGSLLHYMAGTQGGAGIWNGGGGPAVDAGGAIYATSGNGFSTTTFDHSESIVKLSPTLHELDHWAPSNWAALNAGDVDLGSANAMVLPAGLLFQSGKEGNGYLVRSATGSMGGTGGSPAFQQRICSPGSSFGGPAYSAGRIYVPCDGGVVALALKTSPPSFHKAWTAFPGATGPPIVAGGLVWSVSADSATLYGLSPASGKIKFQSSLPAVNHFTSPSAAGGRLFVSSGQTVTAFRIASAPS